ncbi:MAG: type II toxin-antitoxin system RelE/ParE family toxin [Actinobacteria bacterium]|nr:type II toxin-antitoxin system RelE/ParE family toxin [Actinomycetota bacterium]
MKPRYRVVVRPAAQRALRRIDQPMRARIEGAIAMLAQDPRPPASRQLVERDGYRVRIGDYRVLYTIDDGVLIVAVVSVGHRREVYRR